MSHKRTTNVFFAAMVSIIIGLFVLKSLDHAPVQAQAFSLSDYQRLGSVEKFFSDDLSEPLRDWDGVEIYYYQDSGSSKYDSEKCHFVVWNGFIGSNGQVQSTMNWRKQLPYSFNNGIDSGAETIQICIVTEGNLLCPTDIQVKRVETLAEVIARKFSITPEHISYPGNWR